MTYNNIQIQFCLLSAVYSVKSAKAIIVHVEKLQSLGV